MTEDKKTDVVEDALEATETTDTVGTILGMKDILKIKNDVPKELVSVPEWGGSVWVFGMTGEERDDYEASIMSLDDGSRNMKNLRSRACVIYMRDEAGNKLFKAKHIAALAGKSSKALDRIFEVGNKLSGIGRKDQEKMLKNS